MTINCSLRVLLGVVAVLIGTGGVGGWYAAKRFAGPVGRPLATALPDGYRVVGPNDPSPWGPGPGSCFPGATDRNSPAKVRERLLVEVWLIFRGKWAPPYGPGIPGGATDPPPTEAQKLYGQAFALLQDGKSAEATAVFTRLVALDPNDKVAYAVRGWIRDRNKDPEKAAADYTEAVRCGAHQILLDRAALHMRAGDFDKAVADCTQALNKLPPREWAAAYTYRAVAHAMKGEFQSCEDDLNRVSEMEDLERAPK